MFDFLKKKNYWESNHEELKEIDENQNNQNFLKNTLKYDSDIHRRAYSLFYLTKLKIKNEERWSKELQEEDKAEFTFNLLITEIYMDAHMSMSEENLRVYDEFMELLKVKADLLKN